MVSFGDAIKLFFTRYTDFQGRSRRSEYWWVFLFNLIIGLVGGILLGLVGGDMEAGDLTPAGILLLAVLALYFLAILIPSIALTVRRLHDFEKTGWFVLALTIIGMIPILGLISNIAYIVIGCIPGTAGPNRFGPDPKGAYVAETFA